MKKLIGLLIFSLVLILSACSGSNAESDVSIDDVIQAFTDAGLEVGSTEALDKSEFGNIRKDGKRILVPSLGEDSGGRIMSFNKEKDLETAKSYYVELGNSSPLFFSHTYQSGLFLLQMNGDMEDADFEEYEKVMDETIK